MNFFCWQSPGTAHNPYPGARVTAATSSAAAAAFAQGAGIATGVVIVVPETALEAFQVGAVNPVALPPYV